MITFYGVLSNFSVSASIEGIMPQHQNMKLFTLGQT